MSFLKKVLFQNGMEKEKYNIIKDRLYERSRTQLTWFSLILFIAFTVLYAFSFFLEAIAANQNYYLYILIACLAFFVSFHTLANRFILFGKVLKIVFQLAIMAFCIVIGTITSRDDASVAFVVITAMMPLIVYDNALKSLLIRTVMIVVYFFIAVRIKSQDTLQTDFINLVSFNLLSTFCAIALNRIQSTGIYLEFCMEQEIDEDTATIRKNLEKIEALSNQIVSAFSKSIDAKDEYTNGHSMRVARYSKMIAERLGKSEEEQNAIYCVAAMHDIGKIGIPDGIINKDSKLTDEEYNLIKQHTVIGYNILSEIDELPDIAIGAQSHHERYDGTGYPFGLSGEDIPEIARIIAVADAYDAMTSDRSYRRSMPQKQVVEELKNGRGTQFDPLFADVMLDIIEHDKEYALHE